MIETEFLNDQDKYETKDFEKTIKKVLETALDCHKIKGDCEISVVFTNGQKIREINRQFRNIDRETDVLSFPQYEYETEGILKTDDNPIVLGDIVINLEKAEEQSNDFNHSFMREVGYLAAHSVLHLLGYDHMKEDEKKRMREKEEEIMNKINLTRED